MNTAGSIQLLADAKLNEAEFLFAHKFYDLAFYVAGYAVELYIKARICTVLNMPDFFDFENRKKFENEDNITKPYKVHNYTQLLILSGLFPEHNKMLSNADFKNNWEIIIRWKESQRYASGKKEAEVNDFIDSVKSYTGWIRQFL